MNEYKSAEQQIDTVNYQVIGTNGCTIVTRKSFWAKNDNDAREQAKNVNGLLCRVIER